MIIWLNLHIGLHLLLYGTTDLEKRFHEYSIKICTTETDADFEHMFRAIKKALYVNNDKFVHNLKYV